MMSIESFAKMLRPRVEARTPFLAHWHPGGMMVLNTGEYTVEEYDVMIGEPGKAKRHHAKSKRAPSIRCARLSPVSRKTRESSSSSTGRTSLSMGPIRTLFRT